MTAIQLPVTALIADVTVSLLSEPLCSFISHHLLLHPSHLRYHEKRWDGECIIGIVVSVDEYGGGLLQSL
jgi:hypothetical protein